LLFATVIGVPRQVLRFRFPPKIGESPIRIAQWSRQHLQLDDALAGSRRLDAAGCQTKHGSG